MRPFCTEIQFQRHRKGLSEVIEIMFIPLTHVAQCIRVAEHNTRKMLIEELLHRTRLEKLLRDSFGNYCVQVRSNRCCNLLELTMLPDRLRLRRTQSAYGCKSYSDYYLGSLLTQDEAGRRHPPNPPLNSQYPIRQANPKQTST